MAYIIENVQLLKRKSLEQTSLVIKNNRIATLLPHVRNYHYMKMNARNYCMTPTHVFLDSQLPWIGTFEQMKPYVIDEIIKKGCTTVVTYVQLEHERKLKETMRNVELKLLSSPIDFVTCLKIQPRQMTISLARALKREKIPALFFSFSSIAELDDIPWGWIREAIFPYHCLFIPIFSTSSESEKHRLKLHWSLYMTEQKIPHLVDELKEGEPLAWHVLEKVGISPLKSHIHPGAEVSYNLYVSTDYRNMFDETELFIYDYNRLHVTVHKGTVIRAGDCVWIRPGFGEHVSIKLPRYFNGE